MILIRSCQESIRQIEKKCEVELFDGADKQVNEGDLIPLTPAGRYVSVLGHWDELAEPYSRTSLHCAALMVRIEM